MTTRAVKIDCTESEYNIVVEEISESDSNNCLSLLVYLDSVGIRILRSARKLGWCTVALYTTEPSLDINHATYADEAVKLEHVSQYMNVSVILGLALMYVWLYEQLFALM